MVTDMNTEYLQIKVTRINGNWHARLFDTRKEKHIDEMACKLQEDISYICYEMLRWHDKLGGVSPMASAARHRKRETYSPIGKVWNCFNK